MEFEKATSFENSGNLSEELFGIKTSDTNTSSESYYTCTSEKRFKLCNLALACDRIGVLDRSASLLVNAVLKDFHTVTKENPSRIVDRSKIRREQKNRRLQLQECARNDHFEVQGLFFDGKKDVTFHQDKEETKYYRKYVTEGHIVLVPEPGSKYLCHVTPSSETAMSIASSIQTFLEDPNKSFILEQVKAVGCDGTVTNTGWKNGVISQLELFLGRPVQWLICLLHTNELPLRHLIQHLDRKTNHPTGFKGAIRKMLENCEKLSVVSFEPIDVELPNIDPKELSTVQKYLFDICNGISRGNISMSLSLRDPGKISHLRWLTTANRFLRLYVSTINPSLDLKILTKYVIKVYSASWFEIKMKPTCLCGSNHFFGMIKKSRYLSDELKNIVDPVLQRNGYFCHPENILLAMLVDKRLHIRELGLIRIIKCRESYDNHMSI